MRALEQCLAAYGPYHRDTRNKLTHALGVPLLVVALLIPMPLWLGAAVVAVAVVYYLRFDWVLGAFLSTVFVALLIVARTFDGSWAWALALFVAGWAFQFLGHYFEGRKPALMDNLSQVLNAPVFLGAEFLFLLGWRSDLRTRLTAPNHSVR